MFTLGLIIASLKIVYSMNNEAYQSDDDISLSDQLSWNKFCTDGSIAVGSCFKAGTCGDGYRCDSVKNLCCIIKSTVKPVCPNGGTAAAACINGKCGRGLICLPNKLCCRRANDSPVCPNKSRPVGQCMEDLCPCEHECINGMCCPTRRAPSLTALCPDGTTGSGTCDRDNCLSGYYCVSNTCCQMPSCPNSAIYPAGPCIENIVCPFGHVCTKDNWCCPSTSCPNDVQSSGECKNDMCYAGFVCFNGVCCKIPSCPETPALPLGPCVDGLFCPHDHYCTTSKWCCSIKIFKDLDTLTILST